MLCRCGALQVGDQVLAVGSVRVDAAQGVGVAEVQEMLQQAPGSTLALEVLPISYSSNWRLSEGRSRGYANSKSSPVQPPSPCSSPSGFSTLNLHRRGHYSRSKSDNAHEGNSSSSVFGGICHTESLLVILEPDEHGFGLSARDSGTGEVVVSHIESDSPAERSGCIQTGDRILVVGTHSITAENLTAGCVMHMLQEMSHQASRLSLQLEFDVADSVVPSSGIFSVKLAKRGSGLGITITASKTRTAGEPLLISDIRRGSVAHRTGSLQPGDRLLAINGVLLDQCSLEDTQHILQNSSDIVTLRVQKDDSFSEHPQNQIVVYTVELVRHGGPLGITIAGSEQPFEPITISGLTVGGLAEKTGALHVGDRLLAICGESLQGKPLSEAISLLQNSGDTVTLKIARTTERTSSAEQQKQSLGDTINELSAGQFGPALPSVDSAVESWDSMMGHASPSNHVSVMELYQAESATVKRRHKADLSSEPQLGQWDGLSRSSHSIDSGQSGSAKKLFFQRVLSEDDTKGHWGKTDDVANIESSETKQTPTTLLTAPDENQTNLSNPHLSCNLPDSPLPLPHYMHCNNDKNRCNGNTFGTKLIKEASSSTGELYDVEGCASFLQLNTPTNTNPSHMQLYQVTLFKDPVYEDFGFSVSDGLYERGVFINRIRKGGPADLSAILKPFDRILQVNDTRTHDFDCCLTVPLIASAGEKLELTVARNPYCSSENNIV
ncbi:Protein lap4 [Gryllus bimaculatus]|nr:Protein lap4 [Gryllus bimaculatus]